jgi:methylglutaconyl-CoA hydratase
MTEPIARPLSEHAPDLGDDPSVQLAVDGSGAAIVLLNRPEKRNAFNAATIAGLHQAFETLHGADPVRVVFLRGAGGTFSAGGDLDWMRGQADASEHDNRADALQLARMLKALHDIPALTVALVEGPAMGGGAGLVAACDVAVATPDAAFAFSEVKLGLTPATISPYVVQAVGRAAPARCSPRAAASAPRRRSASADRRDRPRPLGGVQERIAGEMIACAPGAVGEAKRLVDLVHGARIDRGYWRRRQSASPTPGPRPRAVKACRAFLERRKPSWAEDAGG